MISRTDLDGFSRSFEVLDGMKGRRRFFFAFARAGVRGQPFGWRRNLDGTTVVTLGAQGYQDWVLRGGLGVLGGAWFKGSVGGAEL
jgi:hypothetical protein